MNNNLIVRKILKLASQLVSQEETFQLDGIKFYIGKRSNEVKRKIFDPFIKEYKKNMTKLKGKWDGYGKWIFKNRSDYEIANNKLKEIKDQWDKLQKEFPEGKFDYSEQIEKFFKQVEKRGF